MTSIKDSEYFEALDIQEDNLDQRRVATEALRLFGDNHGKALKWMTQPRDVLGDISPIQAMATPEGLSDVEDLIMRIQHGVFS